MRKVIPNKWLILAALLVLSLSAFSVIVYKNTRSLYPTDEQCCKKPSETKEKGEMILDAVSRQFTSFISIR